MLLRKLLLESKRREYSCLMAMVPSVLSNKIMKWSNDNILDSSLSYEGDDEPRCKDFHVTVIFGLHTDDYLDIDKYLPSDSFEIKLGKISMFDSDNYQVLKIEVSSPELVKLHNLIKDNVDNTQTHAKYNPHLTIGYLKKGKSDDFIGCMDFDGESFPVSKYCFSNKDGSDEVIRI